MGGVALAEKWCPLRSRWSAWAFYLGLLPETVPAERRESGPPPRACASVLASLTRDGFKWEITRVVEMR